MAKKGMTKKEVYEHIKDFDARYKTIYLNNALKKKGLLTKKTQQAIYNTLGESYVERAIEEAEGMYPQLASRNYKEAAKFFSKAKKGKKMVKAKAHGEIASLKSQAEVRMGDEGAAEKYKKALKIAKKINDKKEIKESALGAANKLYSAGFYLEAAKLYEEAGGNKKRAKNIREDYKSRRSRDRSIGLSVDPESGRGMIAEKVPSSFYDKIFKSAKKTKAKSLERKAGGTLAIIGALGAIFFFSPNITGNVIGDISTINSDGIGIALIVIALMGLNLWKRK